MKEQIFPTSETLLDGIDWSKLERPKATVIEIQIGHYEVDYVHLVFKGQRYRVALMTANLDLDEAELACRYVPEWWDESKNTGALYDVLGQEV